MRIIDLSARVAAILAVILTLTSAAAVRADDANTAKAQDLVKTAINMTDSDQAVKMLWQATDLDPTLNDAYVYLGFYYNSRSDFAQVVKVYQKLAKYEPKEPTVYLNIGEAYMSFSPPQLDSALGYYRKAYQLDPTSSLAALRIGEVLSQQPGGRDESVKFLRLAATDSSRNPAIAAEAQKLLGQMGSP
jgi:tetratricopeptide (TPR) repeat protein